MNITTEGSADMFRTLVAFPAEDVTRKAGTSGKQAKEEWNETQRHALEKVMSHFLTTKSVKPYPMPAVNPDRAFKQLCDSTGVNISLDNAIASLNSAYKEDKLIFLTQKAKGCTKTDTRKPSPLLKAYAYSTANPDGWFSDYLFPLYHSFGGVSTQASKLCHRSYGSMNDLLEVEDMDWEASFLPSVIFLAWDEPPKSGRAKKPTRKYDMLERSATDVTDDGEWAKLLSDTVIDKVGRHGIIAIAECKL
jgi:hypothetical protein